MVDFTNSLNLTQTTDTIILTVAIVLGLTVFGLIAALVIHLKSFKYDVTLKYLTNNTRRVINTKAKEIEVDGGKFWLILDKKKLKGVLKAPIPDADCIDLTNKGNFYCLGYVDTNNNVTWANDDTKYKEPPKELYVLKNYEVSEEKQAELRTASRSDEEFEILLNKEQLKIRDSKIKEWLTDNNSVGTIEPYNNNQRMAQFKLHQRELEKRGKGFKDLIQQALVYGSFIIIICVLIFGYGEFAEPKERVKQMELQINQLQLEQLTVLKELKQDIQTLKDNTNVETVNGGVPPN